MPNINVGFSYQTNGWIINKGCHPINAIKWKRTERTLSHDPLPPRQSVRLNGDLRAASLGTITTDLQPMPVKRL